VVVREESDPTAQKENEASKQGGNTSQVGSGKSESTSSYEKGNSADSKTKISRKVAPYASGAGSWAVTAATKEPKQTYKMVSQIDPRKSISEILGSSDLSDPATRAVVSAYMADREEARYQSVLAKANQMGIPVRINGPGHNVSILYDIRREGPLYRKTLNTNAAISTGANLLNKTPYGLNGEGMTVGVWDAARARTNHVELIGKVTVGDSTTGNDDHSTHVAGTIAAKGVDPKAKGMGVNTLIRTYDWNSDTSEMTAIGAAVATDGATRIPISNHSYGYGATNVDLGRYEAECNTFDALAKSMPFYQIFWAAGNEQQDYGTPYGGYQSITFVGLAKNVISVGAANDAVTSGVRDVTKGTLASFSSMGPCNDGRIKPDIVANGVNVYSCVATNTNSYDGTYSGTSMATPNAAGTAALLMQLYKTNFSGQLMRASMLKALMIHTADDVGRPGPDYQYGWGYMNAKAAADVILAHKASLAEPKMIENTINNANKVRTNTIVWDGSSPIRATLVWTDVEGVAQTATNSRTRNLVNDLDLKITAPNGTTTYLPYVMPFVGSWTTASMTSNAVTGINNVDNVERVDIPAPTQAGTYTVTVGMYGTNSLSGTSQIYSLIVTGSQSVEANPPPVVNITAPTNGTTVLPGSPILITATATDLTVGGQSGQVTKVEFFDGATRLGEDTSAPYEFSWSNPSSGVHVLTAKATDNASATAVSSSVNVTVLVGSGSPTITGFSPASGVAGDSVVILGENLGIASSVRFGALAATFTADSPLQVTASVPLSAVTAPITVSNSYGSVTTSSNFTIIPIVFREDFASLTAGDNTTSSGSSTPWVGNTNFPTNTVVKAYQAGGAVRLGAKGAVGSITSRAINLAGNGGAFNVSFKVKGWSTKEGDIKVTAGSQSQNVTYAATMSESFESKTLNFTGGTSATTIMIETTAGRAYIDDVTVTSEAPSSPPVITSATTKGGVVGQAFSYQIAASNAPTSFGASNLPSWASINTTSGVISGIPLTAGTKVAIISATNNAGPGSTNLTISIISSGGGVVTNTVFSENMGMPTGTTNYASNTFENSGTLTYDSGGIANPADVRMTSVSSNYFGSSGSGNIFFSTSTNAASAPTDARGFSIESINAANFGNLELTYGYRKETATALATFSVDYWNGSAWVTVANTASTLFNEATNATTGWYLAKALALPTNAQMNGLKLRFVKTGTNSMRIDDVKLTGTISTSPTISARGSLSSVNTTYGTALTNPTSFTLSGTNMIEGITVAPPSGFEVSAGNANSFAGKDSSITVGSAGTVAATPIYVRLAADTPVGTYTGNITCRSVGATEASVATVASTVSPRPISVTADSVRKTYGASDPELTYTATEIAPFSGILVRDPGEAVASYRIRQGSLTAGSNFVISFTEGDFSILKKRLSVIANDRTKAFGQTLTLGPGQTAFTTSEMGGTDKIDTVTITASGGTEANDPVATYVLTPSNPVGQNFTSGNYDIYYTLGTLTVTESVPAGSTFEGWAGKDTVITPELLMKYAIGGAASPSAAGEVPVVAMQGSALILTAIVRKDSTLTIIGQAVSDLGNYGTPNLIVPVDGSAVDVSQRDVPPGCERQKFTMDMGSSGKGFLRISVKK